MANLTVLKLKTGETLFAETTAIPTRQDAIGVINPFIIKYVDVDNNTSSFYAAPWVPFTDHTKFMMTVDMIALAAPLNATYRRFYGLTYLKSKLFELNALAAFRISKGEDRDVVIEEIFKEMDKEHSETTFKAGDLEFNIDEFKEYSLNQLKTREIQTASQFSVDEMFEMDEADVDKTKLH